MRRAIAIAGVLVSFFASGPPADSHQRSCGIFNVPIPSSPTDQAQLSAVSGEWAVGFSTANQKQPLVEQFNGSAWAAVNTPVPPNSYVAALTGLASFAPNDVWAVGGYNGINALIEHWNGARWSIVAGAPGVTDGLHAVAVNPHRANDVWAVGGTTVEHWNGKFWKAVKAPHGSHNDFGFAGVSVSPSGQVWAVGIDYGVQDVPWIDFFDGTKWQHVQGALTDGILNGVAAPKDGDVWAVGASGTDTAQSLSPAIEHWDGTSWSLVSLPTPADLNGQFYSVSASEGNVWAAGAFSAFGSSDVAVPIVVVSRVGLPWIDVTTSSEVLQQRLTAIAALPDHAVEAVGNGVDGSGAHSLYAIAGGCVL